MTVDFVFKGGPDGIEEAKALEIAKGMLATAHGVDSASQGSAPSGGGGSGGPGGGKR